MDKSFTRLLRLVLVCCLSTLYTANSQLTMLTVQEGGNDSLSCIPPPGNTSQTPCKTLKYAFTQTLNESNVEFQIDCGVFSFEGGFLFASRANVTINSVCANDTPIVMCMDGSNLIFQKCANIRISGILLENCGLSTSSPQAASLLFNRSHSVRLDAVHVQNSPHYGISFLNTRGKNILRSVTVMSAAGGSGLYIEMDDNAYLSCDDTDSVSQQCRPVEYTIDGAVIAGCNSSLCDDVVEGTPCVGGGMVLVLKEDVKNIHIDVTDTTVEGNTALLAAGGGFVGLLGNTANNTIFFRNSTFSSNTVNSNSRSTPVNGSWRYFQLWTSGGGMTVLFSDTSNGNSVTFDGTTVAENIANTGGGMSVIHHNEAKRNRIIIHNCTFDSNAVERVREGVCSRAVGDSVPRCTGNGGGLAVSFTHQAEDNHCEILSSRFTYNTYTDVGGGLSVIHYDNSIRNTISAFYNLMENNAMNNIDGDCENISSLFWRRIAQVPSGGGASVIYLNETSHNTLEAMGTYKSNTAVRGGGLFVGFYSFANNNLLTLSGLLHNNTLQHRVHRSRGGGGTLVEYDTQDSMEKTRNTVHFKSMIFADNDCAGSSGGGVAIIQQATRNPNEDRVIVTNNINVNNTCRYGRGVAAVSVKTYFSRYSLELVLEKNNLFLALVVPDLSEFMDNITDKLDPKRMLDDDTTFNGFNLTSDLEKIVPDVHKLFEDFIVDFQMDTCDQKFVKNLDLSNLNSLLDEGQGGVYLRSMKMSTRGRQVMNCAGVSQGLFAIDSKILFNTTSDITICHCTATHGGGIAVYSDSFLTVAPNVRLRLIKNKALQRGGGIYVRTAPGESSITDTCFLQYTDTSVHPKEWQNVTLEFIDNKADIEGNSIYIRQGRTCLPPRLDRETVTETQQILQWQPVFNFTSRECTEESDDKCQRGAVVSGPAHVEFTVKAAEMSGRSNLRFHSFLPGKLSKLPVSEVLDIFNQTSHAVFVVSLVPGRNSNHTVRVDPFTTFTTNFQVKLEGTPFGLPTDEVSNNVSLWEDLPRLVLQARINPELFSYFVVNLECCPPGFNFVEGNESTCTCDNGNGAELNYIKNCSDNFVASLAPNRWVGYNEEKDKEGCNRQAVIYGRCPHGYCSERTLKLPENRSESELDKIICGGQHRTGQLCGRCKQDFSVPINFDLISPGCHRCDSLASQGGIAVWIVSEWIPLMVVMAILLLFNVDLMDGKWNAFLLFAQINSLVLVRGREQLQYQGGNPVHSNLTNGALFLYNIWNLDFFGRLLPPYCLVSNTSLNFLQVLLLSYTTCLVPLVVVALIVLVEKYADKCCKPVTTCLYYIREFKFRYCSNPSYDRALTSFYILGFTRFLSISTYILAGDTIYYASNKGEFSRIVYWQGDVEYFSSEHIFYFLLAISVMLALVSVPTIILVLFPTLPLIFDFMKTSKHKWLNWVGRAKTLGKFLHRMFTGKWTKHFLDVCQGSFKYEYRIFASFFFLYRIFVMVVAQAIFNINNILVIQLVTTVVFTMLVSVCQPYRKRLYNIIDSLILGNLSIILVLNFNQENVETASGIQLVLIYLPIVCLAGVVVVYLVKFIGRCIKTKVLSKMKRIAIEDVDFSVNYQRTDSLLDDNENDEELNESGDVKEISWRVKDYSISYH